MGYLLEQDVHVLKQLPVVPGTLRDDIDRTYLPIVVSAVGLVLVVLFRPAPVFAGITYARTGSRLEKPLQIGG